MSDSKFATEKKQNTWPFQMNVDFEITHAV